MSRTEYKVIFCRRAFSSAIVGLFPVLMASQLFGQNSNSSAARDGDKHNPSIGREVSVPAHLRDGQEFTVTLSELLSHGRLLFNASWTEQEGGGRPLTKGTGRPLSDPTRPLVGARAF